MSEKNELQSILKELAKASSDLSSAALSNDFDAATSLLSKIKVLEAHRDELVKSTPMEKKQRSNNLPLAPDSLRENVIRVLRFTGTPTQAKLIANIAEANFSQVLDTKKLSYLRRDEQRSYKAGLDSKRRTQLRDVYVVPALSSDRLAPVRGALALSTWCLADRLIAPLSPRVNLLKSTIALVDEVSRRKIPQSNEKVMRLIRRLGSSIPGVNPFEDDIKQILAAARDELAIIQERDAEERKESAEKFAHIKDNCLFGNTLSRVELTNIEGAQ